MTRDPALSLSIREEKRRTLPWKGIERTVHKPGDWRQTPTGFERVPS